MIAVIDKANLPPKTKPKGRHPDKALSASFVRSAGVGRHADGNGLYLFVQPSGSRSWIQRLIIRGRRRELGLGSVALVSLAEAREKALANRKLAREGGDPLAEKRRAPGRAQLRRSRCARAATEAGRLAQFDSPEGLAEQPGTLRFSADRQDAGLRSEQCRPTTVIFYLGRKRRESAMSRAQTHH